MPGNALLLPYVNVQCTFTTTVLREGEPVIAIEFQVKVFLFPEIDHAKLIVILRLFYLKGCAKARPFK